MAPERKLAKEDIKNARLWHVLLWLRYALPLFSALLLLLLGAFYNVFATELGRPMRLSVWRLLFNTLKNARAYLMSAAPLPGVRSFYILLIVLGVGALLLFLISVVLSAFVLYTAYRVRQARQSGIFDEEKRAKILLRAILPNRIVMAFSNLLVLPLAFFPEIFSLVNGRYSAMSGSIFRVRCNVTALVLLIVLLATVVLAVLLRPYEKALDADLYDIKDEGEAVENSEN